ncbi:ArnT family glycosyltransferase [Aquisphaera giovannonii]|nr:glycosyltransferase family 39 protein [Aquisphaera giovannonii]
MRPQPHDAAPATALRREVLWIAAATVVGAALRLQGLPRLGFVHFDEGIYAMAGLWPFRTAGLAGLDPSVIPYAPVGFPFLVGLFDMALGPGDAAAILASIVAGVLTIPAAGWLARRTFGPGAGAAAATLVALSCFHVSFSRMALTDATFLLAWVLGLALAGRFLERPGFGNAMGLGAGVGAAQLVKYNGWLLGAAVIAVAAAELADPRARSDRRRLRAVWGFGAMAAVVAAAIYAPWFRFVDAHGGYGSLLAHHRSYMGGVGSWMVHLGLQFEEADALSGGWTWRLAGYGAAALASLAIALPRSRASWREPAWLGLGLLGAVVLPRFLWPASASMLPASWRDTPAARLLAAAWLMLTVLTPFYHPYARLWLPLLLLCWVLVAGLVARALRAAGQGGARPVREILGVSLRGRSARGRVAFALFFVLVAAIVAPDLVPRPLAARPPRGLGPWDPSDSLRVAVREALPSVPAGVPSLRVLARPAAFYYIGGRISAQLEPGLSTLLEPERSGRWALVDAAMLDQEGDREAALASLLERWDVVGEFPARLNLPTLLDRDPLAARRPSIESAASVPLWLLRPRMPGAR